MSWHWRTLSLPITLPEAGPWFNKKMLSYQYWKSHCGDKTVVRSSYLHNGISHTGKISLYWIRALVVILGMSLDCHWGRVTHICVGNLTIIGSDNGLSPGRRQAIIRTNAWILLIGSLGTNFSEILVGNQTFLFRKCTWKCRLCYSAHFVSASMS